MYYIERYSTTSIVISANSAPLYIEGGFFPSLKLKKGCYTMTNEQHEIYKRMKMIRVLRNTVGHDRESLDKEFEILRKKLGGLQYAEMPIERSATISDTKIQSDKDVKLLEKCEKCNRTFYRPHFFYLFSTIDNKCYSCSSVV